MNIEIKEETYIDLIFGNNEHLRNIFIKFRNKNKNGTVHELIESSLAMSSLILSANEDERKIICKILSDIGERILNKEDEAD